VAALQAPQTRDFVRVQLLEEKKAQDFPVFGRQFIEGFKHFVLGLFVDEIAFGTRIWVAIVSGAFDEPGEAVPGAVMFPQHVIADAVDEPA